MLSTTVAAEPDDAARERRAGRFAARHILWDESALPRVRACGHYRRDQERGVSVLVSGDGGERKAGYGNLQTCGSTWACPVCSAKIASGRQREVEQALAAWTDPGGRYGGRVAALTLTMRHQRGQSLRSLWDALSGALNDTLAGGGWEADKVQHGSPYERVVARGRRKGQVVAAWRIPTIRVVEVTHGDSGWHVHVHALLLLPWAATEESVAALGASIFRRWSRSLVAAGMSAPMGERVWDARKGRMVVPGYDVHLMAGDPCAALAEYFTKAVYAAAAETVQAGSKVARGRNRTPFQVLADVVRCGDAEDLAIWHEWERASKGRRQIAWSVGLRAELVGGEEATDQEMAEADDAGVVVHEMDGELWRAVRAARADYDVLRAFERSTREGVEVLMSLSAFADRLTHERATAAATWGKRRSRYRRRA